MEKSTTAKKVLLIIEDKPEELAAAIELAKATGKYEIVGSASSYIKGLVAIEESMRREFDLTVMTDIYIPQENEGEPNAPRGIALALKAKKFGLKVVICTSESTHGEQEFINDIAMINNIPYFSEKNWKRALMNLTTGI